MPPRFGVSAPLAGRASNSNAAAPTANSTLHFMSSSLIARIGAGCIVRPSAGSKPIRRRLFVEPDRRQVLIDEMAGADLPAFDVAAVRHDAVPPDDLGGVRLGVHHQLLKGEHSGFLL